jgi:GntR family transcriptional regulator, histidine utilization repressor
MQGWESLRDQVLSRIRGRDWPPGSLIPNEATLAAEYGVARATMNRALRDLAHAGVLERRRKAGTRVALHPVRKARLDIPVTRLEIEATGARHGLKILREMLETPPAPVAQAMAIDGPLLHLVTLHLAHDVPWLYEDRWLNPAVLPQPGPDFARISANEWLVLNVPLASGDIAFGAAAASSAEATALRVPRSPRCGLPTHPAIGCIPGSEVPVRRMQPS